VSEMTYCELRLTLIKHGLLVGRVYDKRDESQSLTFRPQLFGGGTDSVSYPLRHHCQYHWKEVSVVLKGLEILWMTKRNMA
jgi:hypothetical protein